MKEENLLDIMKNIKNVKLTFTNDKTYTFDNVDEIHMFGRGGSVVKIKSKDLSDDFIKIK